ncbi:ATP-binding protein [bacterium]|nr:ATP-binding protein [Candidatus Omnitrophota bacterium]MBU2528240.1 ATP-binding protein [bacterium]MBU3929618.1 ATP-binding protein [bacterium]MBU4122201.1 ATP-binding protein [bacterium]
MEEIYYAFNPWWSGKEFESGIPRELYTRNFAQVLKRKQIEIIVGSRRVGKTTIIKQMIKKTLKSKYPAKQILYLALDHPQLSNEPISGHLRNFRKLFMHDRRKKLVLFLDEVQESPNWAQELKSVYDMENVKIFCTGSTAALIKMQGGKLTGRQIVTVVYPLNFREFVDFKGVEIGMDEGYKYEKILDEYLAVGGYPENVLKRSNEYLLNLLEDIIARDLTRLYGIRKPAALKDMFLILASQIGSRTSFNKLSNVLGISVDTAKEYAGYFEAAFLIKPMEKWSMSHNDRIYAQKKIYFLDTGFKTLLTGRGDIGAKAENAVFAHLLRKKEMCGYFAEGEREVDFITGSVKSPLPIEVKYDSDFDLDGRKFDGMRLFLKRYPKTKKIIIVSRDKEAEERRGQTVIKIIPLWKYLLI